MKQKQWVRGAISYTVAALFLLYEMALQVSPGVMTQELMRDFGIGAGLLGVMAAVYFYSYTLMQVPSGMCYDRLSVRLIVTAAAALCTLGAFIFALASNGLIAALGRFCMGFGSAFAFIGVLTVAAHWFPSHFALLVGVAQFLAAAGALIGVAPLAVFVERSSWRAVIFALGWLGVGVTLLSFLLIRDCPSRLKRAALPGQELRVQCREVFQKSQNWWVALYAFCSWGPIAVFASLFGVPFLAAHYAISPREAAAAVSMVWVGNAISSPFLGFFSDAARRRRPFLWGSAAIGLVATAVVVYGDGLPFAALLIALFALGLASSGQILCFAVAREMNAPTVVSTAMGLTNMAVVAGGALLQPLAGWLISLMWNGERVKGVPVYALNDYHLGLALLPLCFLTALILSLFAIRESYTAHV